MDALAKQSQQTIDYTYSDDKTLSQKLWPWHCQREQGKCQICDAQQLSTGTTLSEVSEKYKNALPPMTTTAETPYKPYDSESPDKRQLDGTLYNGYLPAHELDKVLQGKVLQGKTNVTMVHKGTYLGVDSYSAILDALGNPTPHIAKPPEGAEGAGKEGAGTPFLNWLLYKDYDEIHVCGIARNVCVQDTFLHLIQKMQRGTIKFIYDATLPVVTDLVDITKEALTVEMEKTVVTAEIVDTENVTAEIVDTPT
jgi:nicotinamidase-related amidase